MAKRGFSTGTYLLVILLFLNRMQAAMGDPASFFINILITLPGIFIGITFHEFGHAFVAHKLGDPTPKSQGRVTLNPLAHIDPIGLVCLVFAGFGWGRPVRISLNAYKHPRRDRFLVAFAGVIMNAILVIVIALITRFALPALDGSWSGSVIVVDILTYAISINIMLRLFNLLPVPPLDGFNIITEIFNFRKYSWYGTLYQAGGIILMVLIFFRLTSLILAPAVNAIFNAVVSFIILG